jgi:hypothetical protein
MEPPTIAPPESSLNKAAGNTTSDVSNAASRANDMGMGIHAIKSNVQGLVSQLNGSDNSALGSSDGGIGGVDNKDASNALANEIPLHQPFYSTIQLPSSNPTKTIPTDKPDSNCGINPNAPPCCTPGPENPKCEGTIDYNTGSQPIDGAPVNNTGTESPATTTTITSPSSTSSPPNTLGLSSTADTTNNSKDGTDIGTQPSTIYKGSDTSTMECLIPPCNTQSPGDENNGGNDATSSLINTPVQKADQLTNGMTSTSASAANNDIQNSQPQQQQQQQQQADSPIEPGNSLIDGSQTQQQQQQQTLQPQTQQQQQPQIQSPITSVSQQPQQLPSSTIASGLGQGFDEIGAGVGLGGNNGDGVSPLGPPQPPQYSTNIK